MLFSPTDVDLGMRPEMEETFCNNFVCCGVYLPDLHALLQHYEESHVQVEDHSQQSVGNRKNASDNGNAIEHLDVADSLLEVGGEVSRQQTTSHYYNSPTRPTLPGHQQGGHPSYYSAFDNTIIRKTGINADYEYVAVPNNSLHYNSNYGSIARPRSMPASFNPLHPQQNAGSNASTQRAAFNAPQSRLAALTANKTNLQLLCSILSGSLEPMFGSSSHNATSSTVGSGGGGASMETMSVDSRNADSSSPVSSSLASSTGLIVPMAASQHPQPQSQNHSPFPNGSNHQSQDATNPPNAIRKSNITIASRPAIINRSSLRPYQCPVPSCGRTYKNPNGLKYHAAHGHKNDMSGLPPVERPHRCPVGGCGKKYKNANGLKYHAAHAHQGMPSNPSAHSSFSSAASSHHHQPMSLTNAVHMTPSSLLFSALADHAAILQSNSEVEASLMLSMHRNHRQISNAPLMTRNAAADNPNDNSDESHAEFVDDDNDGLGDEDMFGTAFGTGGIGA